MEKSPQSQQPRLYRATQDLLIEEVWDLLPTIDRIDILRLDWISIADWII
jgi:hypothetical protein